MSANIFCGFKGRWDKLVNTGLLGVIGQINPHEAQEVQLESGGNAHGFRGNSYL